VKTACLIFELVGLVQLGRFLHRDSIAWINDFGIDDVGSIHARLRRVPVMLEIASQRGSDNVCDLSLFLQ